MCGNVYVTNKDIMLLNSVTQIKIVGINRTNASVRKAGHKMSLLSLGICSNVSSAMAMLLGHLYNHSPMKMSLIFQLGSFCAAKSRLVQMKQKCNLWCQVHHCILSVKTHTLL